MTIAPYGNVETARKSQPGKVRALSYSATGRIGYALFGIFCVAVIILVALKPDAHSVAGVYRRGALGWWQGKDIFGPGEHGFIYLPSFAILYSPLAFMGKPVGDLVWRVLGAGVLLTGLWQAIGALFPQRERAWRISSLGVVLLVMLLSSGGAIRNGQATPIMFGLTMLSAVAISRQKWWPAALMLALAFAIKPLVIVFILLAAALYPKQLALRLTAAIAGFMVLPLINIHPAVALHQYQLGIQKLMIAGAPGFGRWSDITGPLHAAGLYPPEWSLTAARIIAAACALALGFVAIRSRTATPVQRLLNLFDLSVVYLLLMCPRTESESYLMLGVLLGLHVVELWSAGDETPTRRREAWILVALSVLLGVDAFGSAIFHATDLWFKPLLCLAIVPAVVANALRGTRLSAIIPTRRVGSAVHG